MTAFTVPGFRVGHWTHPTYATGCTVIVPDERAPAVAEVRGGAPGTRETELLGQGKLVQQVDAILLTGGSAYGLSAADGVVRWLRQQGRGFPTTSLPVPIVPAAVLFDLHGGSPVWPDDASGYGAASNARHDGWMSGRLGAGAGARIGKVLGVEHSSPAGLGAAKVETSSGTVAAIVAVNAIGDIIDSETGAIVAGTTSEAGTWADSEAVILTAHADPAPAGTSTTIGVVAVDAAIDRDTLVRMAIAAHDGLTRAIRPAHTLFDGDTLFIVGRREGPVGSQRTLQLCAAVDRAVRQAIVASVAHTDHNE